MSPFLVLSLFRLRRWPVLGKLFFITQMFFFGIALVPVKTTAQTPQDSRLLELISDDTLAAVFISDPAAVIRSVEKCLLTGDTWPQIESWLCNEESKFATQDQIDDFLESLSRLRAVVREFKSVAIVLHSFEQQRPKFSIVIESTDRQCADLIEEFGSLAAILSDIGIFKEYVAKFNETFGNLQLSKVDRFHVLTHEDSPLPISTMQPNSLIDSRSFRRGWNQVIATPWDIAIYFSPRHAAELAENYLDLHADSRYAEKQRATLPEGFNDIVCICTSINLSDSHPDSLALVRNFLCFTVPRSGLAKEWESYKPITEYPHLPLPVFELKARGDAGKDKNGFGENFAVRLLVETSETTPPWRSAVYLDEVKDRDLAKQYVDELQDLGKAGPVNMRMHEVKSAPESWMAKETDEYARRQVVEYISADIRFQSLTEEQVVRLMEHKKQTRFLDSNWHILGYAGTISNLIEHREDYEDYGVFIQRKLDMLTLRTRPLSRPFCVEANSPLTYSFMWRVYEYYWPTRRANNEQAPSDVPLTDREVLSVCTRRLIESIANQYGTQLWVYSQSAPIMQIDVQVFPSPDLLFPSVIEKFGDELFRNGYQQR